MRKSKLTVVSVSIILSAFLAACGSDSGNNAGMDDLDFKKGGSNEGRLVLDEEQQKFTIVYGDGEERCVSLDTNFLQNVVEWDIGRDSYSYEFLGDTLILYKDVADDSTNEDRVGQMYLGGKSGSLQGTWKSIPCFHNSKEGTQCSDGSVTESTLKISGTSVTATLRTSSDDFGRNDKNVPDIFVGGFSEYWNREGFAKRYPNTFGFVLDMSSLMRKDTVTKKFFSDHPEALADVYLQYEVKFYTNLGNFVASDSSKIYCLDEINKQKFGKEYFGGKDCSSMPITLIAWGNTETRQAGIGGYIAKFSAKVKLAQLGEVNNSYGDGVDMPGGLCPTHSSGRAVATDGEDESNSSNSGGSSNSSQTVNNSAGSTYDGTTGILTDLRDGKTYRAVVIAPAESGYSQVWMAENLNYKTDNSWCYDDESDNCAKYGRLYTWAAAMDSVGEWSTNGKGCGYGETCSVASAGSATLVRGICPKGWHLPSNDEFNALIMAVGDHAGVKLKSTSGWIRNGTGMDMYSFSALPAGNREVGGGYDKEGSYAIFWSSTEIDRKYSGVMRLYYNNVYISQNSIDNKQYGFSVRCIKD